MGWGTEYAENCIEIFLDYQDENGFSPCGVGCSNGCEEQNGEMVKSFLAQIALIIYNRKGNISFISEKYYDKMKKYLMWWVKRAEKNGNLAYWNSSVHTGMDNQHERAGYWEENFCCGVDLNCYLVREFKAFGIIAELRGEKTDKEYFEDYAQKVENAIQSRMWNETDKIYYDIDKNTGTQIKVKYIGA